MINKRRVEVAVKIGEVGKHIFEVLAKRAGCAEKVRILALMSADVAHIYFTVTLYYYKVYNSYFIVKN